MKDAENLLPLKFDLPNECITRSNGSVIRFKVESFRKYCLVNGLDDIGLTMKKDSMISEFEEKRSKRWPWLDGLGYVGKVVVAGDAVEGKKEISW